MSQYLRLGALVALTVSAVALAGCSGASPAVQTEPVAGGTLVIGESGDTSEMDPQTSYYDIAWRVHDLVYDSLVTVDENAEILPSLAESWTVDGNVYTFTLRDGVTFSNGRALTSEDVVGSIERVASVELGSYWRTQLGPIESVEAVDDATVKVTLAAPWQPFLAALASTSASILPMAELEDGTFDPETEMIGTGPFLFDDHVQDQSWTLSKNPKYWDAENVSLDGVTMQIVPDDSARLAGLRDGSLDMATFAGPDAPALLESIPNVESTVQASSDEYWLMLNAINPESPFVDLDQRLAIAHSVDRDGLIQTPLAGQGEPTGVAPANLPDSCAPDDLPTYGGSPEVASDFIAEEGIEPAAFSLMAPPYGPVYTDVTEYLQQGFIEAGFDVTIETPEIGAFVERELVANPSDFDATVDYLAGYLSPTMMAQALVIDDPATGGFGGFAINDAELEQLIVDANAATDPDEHAHLVQQLCAHVAETANIIPLATRSTTLGVRTDQVDATIPTYDGYDVFFRNLPTYVKLG